MKSVLCMFLALAMSLSIAYGASAASSDGPAQPEGFWSTTQAYEVKTAYWVGLEPHYGAFFNGLYGYGQHWLGAGGDAATCSSSGGCISGWNWWSGNGNVLLLPKIGWLFGGPSGVWTGSNYQATLYFN